MKSVSVLIQLFHQSFRNWTMMQRLISSSVLLFLYLPKFSIKSFPGDGVEGRQRLDQNRFRNSLISHFPWMDIPSPLFHPILCPPGGGKRGLSALWPFRKAAATFAHQNQSSNIHLLLDCNKCMYIKALQNCKQEKRVLTLTTCNEMIRTWTWTVLLLSLLHTAHHRTVADKR